MKRAPQAGGDEALTFVHLTDPHLTSPAGARAAALLNKRILGYLSWRRRRRFLHRPEVLAALVADIRRSGAAHVAITGDLTQVGLPEECRVARRWLDALSPPEAVSLVPGNHDRYVSAEWRDTIGLWAPYMRSHDPAAGDEPPEVDGEGFPALRVRGPVAFIGLSSARASYPFLATGHLGRTQREGLAQLLATTASRGLFRVVLIHHPPVPGSYKWRKRLTDDVEAAATLREQGAELVLHGHTHKTTVSRLAGPAGTSIPVVGLPSASEPGTRPERAARYSLWTVQRVDGRCRLTHRSRVYDETGGVFRDCADWDPLADS